MHQLSWRIVSSFALAYYLRLKMAVSLFFLLDIGLLAAKPIKQNTDIFLPGLLSG